MKSKALQISARVFCGLMAILIFNISVDIADGGIYFNTPEDLTQNDQETVLEWILETALGIENAVAETEDPDAAGEQGFQLKKVEIVTDLNLSHRVSELQDPGSLLNCITPHHVSECVVSINTPPPRS